MNESNAGNDQAPVVPSLASSVPSIIDHSSPLDNPVVTRSRSDADGEEPTLSPSLPPPPALTASDDGHRPSIRQPADGLGNPSTMNLSSWRTSHRDDEHDVLSWSNSSNDDDDDDDDDEVPPSSRQRPVLIGGEDNRQYHPSTDADTLITNLSLNINN